MDAIYDVHKHRYIIFSSLTVARTYYLYRTNGAEIKFEIDQKGRLLAYKHTLHSGEIAAIRKYVEAEIC